MDKEQFDKDSEDDDLNFDFSKVKSFFSKKYKKSEEEKESKSKTSDKEDMENMEDSEDSNEKMESEVKSESKSDISAHDKQNKHDKHDKKSHEEKQTQSHKAKSVAKKSEDDEESEEESDVNFDFTKFKNFLSSAKLPLILTILLVLIPVVLTLYVRSLPQDLLVTDNWAQSTVDNYFKSQIAAQVNQQYPNLPQANKDDLINQQYTAFKTANKDGLDQQVAQTSEFFKQGFRYEENGKSYTFLGDLDSYYFLRQVRNLVATGDGCDKRENGVCIDSYMIAPLGVHQTISLHPYGIFILYKIVHSMNASFNIMQAAFYLPALIASIAAVAIFFVARRIMNDTAGFFAAIFLAFSPMVLSRTLGSDTDIWNIMFPLVILWIFLEAFEANSPTKRIILAALSGLFVGFFSFAWTGWWYIFDFIIVGLVGFIVIEIVKTIVKHKKLTFSKIKEMREVKSALIIFGVLVLSSLIFVSLFSNFQTFAGAFAAPLNTASEFGIASHATLWPNVYTTVAELNQAGIDSIVTQSSFGNKAFFAVGLIGIILTMVKRKPDFKEYLLICATVFIALYLVSTKAFGLGMITYLTILAVPIVVAIILIITDKDSQIDIKPALILTIWFAGMIFASSKGVRFILLLVPALSVAFGVAIGYVWQYVSRICVEEFKFSEKVAKAALFFILCLILVAPFNVGVATAKQFVPSMNKGWWDSLTKIKNESKPDAIINSWWDFGHWFKFVADRRVTLDGASQNHPNAHWLGLVLQTDNEKLAVAILRMMDCGSNNAFEEVNKKYQDTEKSENIIQELLLMSSTDASKYLKKLGYSSQEIDAISKNMYCDAPEDFFITSEDMVGKAGVWAHFGLWDFDKSYMTNVVKPLPLDQGTKILRERFNFSEDQATNTYYELQGLTNDRAVNDWIAPWPSYISSRTLNCVEQNKTTIDNFTNTTYVIGKNLVCPVNLVVSQDSTSRTVVEGFIFDQNNPKASDLVVGVYDSAGTRRGGTNAKPANLLILNNKTANKIKIDNTTFPYDVVIDPVGKKMLVSAQELSGSMFTKLFFFDGLSTDKFEKFSDVTDITGQRIIVWKVKW